MHQLIIHRLYLEQSTLGVVQLNGQSICFTLELPWLDNQRLISCIPEGVYLLQPRYSERFKAHIEIACVPNRSFILFHPANNVEHELKGCIAPIRQILHPCWGNGSRLAMRKLLLVLQPLLLDCEMYVSIQQATDTAIIELIKKGKL